MTRRDRVRELFWASSEVCSLDAFYQGRLHNGRNEVKPISEEPGWSIRAKWTTHDEVSHVHYFVEQRPSAQMAWTA